MQTLWVRYMCGWRATAGAAVRTTPAPARASKSFIVEFLSYGHGARSAGGGRDLHDCQHPVASAVPTGAASCSKPRMIDAVGASATHSQGFSVALFLRAA